MEPMEPATWRDSEVVRRCWMATVVMVLGGLVAERLGLRSVGGLLMILSAPSAVVFVGRSVRLRDAAAVRNNLLGLCLALLALAFAVMSITLA